MHPCKHRTRMCLVSRWLQRCNRPQDKPEEIVLKRGHGQIVRGVARASLVVARYGEGGTLSVAVGEGVTSVGDGLGDALSGGAVGSGVGV